MSESLKTKYEVLKIIRDNILKGLEELNVAGWQCMEANQQSYKNFDKVILLTHSKNERIGWQSPRHRYNKNTLKFDDYETWIEQQEWEIKVLLKRNVDPVTADTLTTEDIASMLTGWLNGPGVAFFRQFNCANLFLKMSDITPYKDNSDVFQYGTKFILKLQVIKTAHFELDSATPKFEDFVPV